VTTSTGHRANPCRAGELVRAGTRPGSFSGYLEQRLTPAGVELVRSDAVVRNGGEPVSVRDPEAFAGRLIDLSWLPERAWRTEEARAYVPPWYVACYGGSQGRSGPPAS
jgi:hypothetical protein